MHASYDDISSRIGEPPIWFDENAVPRYCTFEPSRSASIHIREIALAEITCQECKRLFFVAFSVINFREQTIAEAIRSKTLHYGDPPRHDNSSCLAGASMNSEPRRILEYWHRNDPKYVGSKNGNKNVVLDHKAWSTWTRDASLEVDIQPNWVKLR